MPVFHEGELVGCDLADLRRRAEATVAHLVEVHLAGRRDGPVAPGNLGLPHAIPLTLRLARRVPGGP